MVEEIELLLDQFAESNKKNGGSSNISKALRSKLRALGHYGGLKARAR